MKLWNKWTLFKAHHKCRIFRLSHPQNGPVSDKQSPWCNHHGWLGIKSHFPQTNVWRVSTCAFAEYTALCFTVYSANVVWIFILQMLYEYTLLAQNWQWNVCCGYESLLEKAFNNLLLATIQWLTSPPHEFDCRHLCAVHTTSNIMLTIHKMCDTFVWTYQKLVPTCENDSPHR